MSTTARTPHRDTTTAAPSNVARDWLLVGLSFATGAYEAIVFLALGRVFTAFQTGNLIFLGMGVGGIGHLRPEPTTVVTSLLAFVAGRSRGTAAARHRARRRRPAVAEQRDGRHRSGSRRAGRPRADLADGVVRPSDRIGVSSPSERSRWACR